MTIDLSNLPWRLIAGWAALILGAPIVTYLLSYCAGRGFSAGKMDSLQNRFDEENDENENEK